ncbi:MAG TPA: hypothetical protein VE646_11100 [Actinomycetota bacterium]|jgi:hypothetical protein|nr:hypothetical protein [Actinomycetota bacterium]
MAILGIALGAGAIVYLLSLRSSDETLALHPVAGDHPEVGDGEPPAEPEPRARRRRGAPRAVGFERSGASASAQAATYVPLAPDETRWQRRVGGLVGLVALVALAAAVLAGAIYQLGHVINETVARFLQ